MMDIYHDSDLDDVLEVDVTIDSVQPYSYEPVVTKHELSDETDTSESEDNTEMFSDVPLPPVEDWCSCANCMNMPTIVESKCCKDTNIVDSKMEGLNCITDHEGFPVNCTNIHVLETSYYEHVLQNGPLREEEFIHEVYRYIAYRRFTRWVYGLLGKSNRRVIPSCAIKAIRDAFPSENYVGFKYPQ